MNKKYKKYHFFDEELRNNNLKEKSIRGGFFIMVSSAVETFLRIGSIAILARLLIPEYFGLINMVTAVIAFAERFKDLGLSAATIQQKNVTHEQISKLFWINVAIGFIIMILISSASILIATAYNEPRLIHITIAISTGFFLNGMIIQHQAILRRQAKFGMMGILQIGSTVFSISVAIILALKGYGYWALVWREVLRSLFLTIGTWILCPWIPGPPKKHIKIDHMLRFGRDITGFNLVVFFTVNLDQILIGKFFGPAHLGLYRQVYQLVFQPFMQLVLPLNYVAEPTLSILQDDVMRYRKYYKRILKLLNFFTMPLIIFLIIYSHDVVLVVLGKKWVEATDIFRILSISAFIRPAADTTDFVLVTCGKTKRYFNLGLVASFILLLSFSIGIFWGALGIAYGHLSATYFLLVIRLYYCFEGTPVDVRIFFDAIAKPLIESITMMIILVFFKEMVLINSKIILLTISFIISIVTYFLIWIMIPNGKEDLREMTYDLIKPLYLDKFFVSSRNRVKFF